MKVLVMPIGMTIGGSEINAMELAVAVQARGHEAVLVGQRGPLSVLARNAGVRVVDVTLPSRGRPRPATAQVLSEVIAQEKPDLVHVYEGLSSAEAFFGVGLASRVPLVATLYGHSADAFIPRCVPVIAGTAQMQHDLRRHRATELVSLLEPPIDTRLNSANPLDGARQRRDWGIAEDEDLVVIVSRLDVWMKIDSLMDTIDAVGLLAADRPVRLAVVGDGPAGDALQARAAAVNERLGRDVVLMVGALADPVPAYRAADVVVGMGTSLLRGMSMQKPSILVSELGYVRPIGPDTVAPLLEQGFWGRGDGVRAHDRLAAELLRMITLPSGQQAELGRWSRQFVIDRHGMDTCTDRLLEIYDAALAYQPSRWRLAAESVRVPAAVVGRKVRDRLPGRRDGVKSLRTPSALSDEYQSAMAWAARRHASAPSTSPASAAAVSASGPVAGREPAPQGAGREAS